MPLSGYEGPKFTLTPWCPPPPPPPWILKPLSLSSNEHRGPSGPETEATAPRAQSQVPRREVTAGPASPDKQRPREDTRRERGRTPRQVAPPSPEMGPGTSSPRATRGSESGCPAERRPVAAGGGTAYLCRLQGSPERSGCPEPGAHTLPRAPGWNEGSLEVGSSSGLVGEGGEEPVRESLPPQGV